MRWWRRLRTPPEPEPVSLRKLVAELEDRCDALSREWRKVQLDNEELLAKLASWAGRQAARERKRAERHLESTEELASMPGAGPPPLDPEMRKAAEKARLRVLAANLRNGGSR